MAGLRSSLSVALLAAQLTSASPFAYQNTKRQAPEEFDWSTVEPSPKLEYVDCYEGSKCARLQLPLDWSQANCSVPGVDAHGNSVEIAIVTVPANVSKDDPSFGGTVLWNPGGPSGNAANSFAPIIGEIFQEQINGEKQYEMLLFDPRGVGVSTPAGECLGSNQARVLQSSQMNEMPPVDSALGSDWFYHANLGAGKICAQGGPDDIKRHMSTASVARDMLAIVDAVEEERQGGNFSVKALPEEEKPRLQYIGISYGTYLGNTFVSMFPGRSGRILLDAVVDPVDYTAGDWLENLHDVEEVLDVIFQLCWEDSSCVMKREGDSGPEDLRRRLEDLLEDMVENPRSVVHDGRWHIITATRLAGVIHSYTYAPTWLYIAVAEVVEAALQGDFSVLLYAEGMEHEVLCNSEQEGYPREYTWSLEAMLVIRCGDSYDPNRNSSWAERVVDTLQEQSPVLGRNWAQGSLMCAGWEIDPVYRFTGPWGSPAPNAELTKGAPSAPVFITSARLDNVTPLRNAYKVSAQHPDSAVLIVDTAKHGVSDLESECVRDAMRTYFQDGVVPTNGTTCEDPGTAGLQEVLATRSEDGAPRWDLLRRLKHGRFDV